MRSTKFLGLLLTASIAFSGAAVAARAPTAQPPGAHLSPAQQYPSDAIAAVVNDEVISVDDLSSRIKMVMLSTNIGDSPQIRARIAAQVLKTMIDEKLQMEEAKRKNVTATDGEVNKALASIAQQNNMSPDQLNAALRARGIDRGALVDRLKASIVWAKLVRRLAADTNPISDAEIDDAMRRLKQNQNEPQSRVAEIFLPVDNPRQDDEVHQLADRLTEQMKQGARFSAVAEQFSQSATAAVGGDLGWIRPEELRPELAKAVTELQPGELSTPIRTPAGYYLLLVLDRRNGRSAGPADTKLHPVQVVFPLSPQATPTQRREAMADAESAAAAAKNCADMLRIGKERAPQLSSEGDLLLRQVAPAMRSLVTGLGVGKPSRPIVEKNGIGIIMVCSKTAPQAEALPSREEVAETLMRQRLDILARRYMRDLRRAAFVDVRV